MKYLITLSCQNRFSLLFPSKQINSATCRMFNYPLFCYVFDIKHVPFRSVWLKMREGHAACCLNDEKDVTWRVDWDKEHGSTGKQYGTTAFCFLLGCMSARPTTLWFDRTPLGVPARMQYWIISKTGLSKEHRVESVMLPLGDLCTGYYSLYTSRLTVRLEVMRQDKENDKKDEIPRLLGVGLAIYANCKLQKLSYPP